ncbi:hypothetical protein UY3_01308 [Chelonia mydas]|uniref:Uncharacterized protein n=1 Tax=Chelonia mydas TaxID=8469 RepID=M7CK57_CHEMY|nr:hypothetical protein UY3_01308 [Chelonia mydas]
MVCSTPIPLRTAAGVGPAVTGGGKWSDPAPGCSTLLTPSRATGVIILALPLPLNSSEVAIGVLMQLYSMALYFIHLPHTLRLPKS